MNLSVYEPDENEEPADSEYMSVQEVAKILGKTAEEIRIGASIGMLPALGIGNEWKIKREAFERDRLSIDEFFEDDPDEERPKLITPDK